MVDKEKVRAKLQIIEENNRRLGQLQNIEVQEFVSDFRNVEAAKHLLQVNIEAMIDIANHIIARNRWKTPEDSASALRQLGENGFFTEDESQLFVKMVKFRNRVVHLYHAVDDKEIYGILQENLKDFELFVKGVVNRIF